MDNEHSFWTTSFTKEDTTSKDCIRIDSVLKLRELAEKLGKENVFAIDTEQQNIQLYLSFTALMQVTKLLINVYKIVLFSFFAFDI